MKIVATTVAFALFAAIARATAQTATEAQAPVAPRFLTDTGLYADATALKVDPRNRRFSPQYPLWSDGATKRRWVQLPAGSKIDVSELEKWELPVGTKFWKEFSFNGRRVETRFLWRVSKDRWVFASYVWNEQQTNAERAAEEGVGNITEIADGKRHSIPSVTECRSCHDSSRTETLGFDLIQLSDARDPNALHAEPFAADMMTLKTLVEEDRLTPARPELVAAPPRIAAGSPVTRAALGYLSTNCGSCHNKASSIASLGLHLKWNDSYRDGTTPDCVAALSTTINVRGHWVVPELPDESRLINPGHPESSAIIRRVKSRRPLSQMPPIGTVIADKEAVDVLTSWIQGNAADWSALAARCVARSH